MAWMKRTALGLVAAACAGALPAQGDKIALKVYSLRVAKESPDLLDDEAFSIQARTGRRWSAWAIQLTVDSSGA